MLTRVSLGLGAVALSSLFDPKLFGAPATTQSSIYNGILKAPHFAPKAKRVIYLFQSGGPSQLDLFDYKPKLHDMFGQNLPDSVRNGQRLTGFTANQATLPLIPSKFAFNQAGNSGNYLTASCSPTPSKIIDDIASNT